MEIYVIDQINCLSKQNYNHYLMAAFVVSIIIVIVMVYVTVIVVIIMMMMMILILIIILIIVITLTLIINLVFSLRKLQLSFKVT